MYKIYVIKQRRGGSERVPGSQTQSEYADVARAGWRAAYYDLRWQTSEHLLLLTHKNEKLYVHRFGSAPGDADYVAPDEDLSL
ncbi:hypothetical protein PANNVG_02903 [Pantoea sp. Nvir]|uniref:hypothetical protein n=1 Tax=unclassified Pantoea TaxID=2630326 RepID=UPI001EF55BDF|nr:MULTISPECIES: hypothetical protein [unclassified Pantoea]MCG7367733.1 hypothetical protein [Pantoea sp. ACRSH]MCG7398165.1 hypothetical protein [Pantoea sp. ACRSC]